MDEQDRFATSCTEIVHAGAGHINECLLVFRWGSLLLHGKTPFLQVPNIRTSTYCFLFEARSCRHPETATANIGCVKIPKRDLEFSRLLRQWPEPAALVDRDRRQMCFLLR